MTHATTTKTHTITWQESDATAEAAQTMTGLDYLRASFFGDLPAPPIGALIGMGAESIDEGRVVFTVTPAAYHNNPLGSTHGGLAATLLDSAMACAIHSTLPAGVGYTTLEIKVNYVRGMSPQTGEVRCIGEVIHRGRRTATAEGKVFDKNGKLCAHGSTTCIILG